MSEISEDLLLKELAQDQQELDILSAEMSQLSNAAVALERFGLNPSALKVMQTTGLLAGTALDKVEQSELSWG